VPSQSKFTTLFLVVRHTLYQSVFLPVFVFQSKCFFFANAMMRNGDWKPMTCEMWISFFVKKNIRNFRFNSHGFSSVQYYIIHTDRVIRYYRKREGGDSTLRSSVYVCNQGGATRRSHVMTLDVLRRSFFFYLDAVKKYTGNDTTRMKPEFSVQML
jgi:hypothetical protein